MNKYISHALIKIDGKYLVIKRTKIKRGSLNSYPLYWDIPGGMVEDNEEIKDAAIRETFEEVNLKIKVGNIIHKDSNYDREKDILFTRIVYEGELLEGENIDNIILQEDEHSDYKLIEKISDLESEKLVPYLYDLIK